MKKLDPIKCPVHQPLTTTEVLDEYAKALRKLETTVTDIVASTGKLFYTLYSNNFRGAGRYANVWKNKECTVQPSYEELVSICENYEFIRVVNGDTVYTCIGYGVVDNCVKLYFPFSCWYEPTADAEPHLIMGYPTISLYTDGKGNTYNYYNVQHSVPD